MAQLLLFIFCCMEHAKYLPCLPYFFMIQPPLSCIAALWPWSRDYEQSACTNPPWATGLLWKKSHSPESIGKTRQKKQVTALYKILLLFWAGYVNSRNSQGQGRAFSPRFLQLIWDYFCNALLRNWSFLCPFSKQTSERGDAGPWSEDWEGKCFCLRKICISAALLKFVPHIWWGLSWILAQGSFPVR